MNISHCVDDGNTLDEQLLRQISRSIRAHVPSSANTGDEQLKQFQTLLRDLFHTISRPTLDPSQQVVCWNVFCSLIDQAVLSESNAIKDFIWSDDGIWTHALDLYLNFAHIAKPKSSRQLLSTLTTSLRNETDRDLSGRKSAVTAELIRSLLDYEDPARAKASAQLLSNLLQKRVITLDGILAPLDHVSPLRNQVSSVETLLGIILKWLGKGEFGSTIATLLSVILDKVDDEPAIHQVIGRPIWIESLENAVSTDVVHVDELRAHILPVLFKRSFSDFAAFLSTKDLLESVEKSMSQPEVKSKLFYAALQTGKELGILCETEGKTVVMEPNMVFIPVASIGKMLSQNSRTARLTALTLLITSHTATRPFSKAVLTLIQRHLSAFFAEVDADFRSEVFGAIQRLIDRVRSITAVLAKQAQRANVQDLDSSKSPQSILSLHRDFLVWFTRFVAWELRPTASYQRHISALKCLTVLTRSGLDTAVSTQFWSKSACGETKWSFNLPVLTTDHSRLVIDLLLNPFDDVRQTAFAILSFYCHPSNPSRLSLTKLFLDARERAEYRMYLSGRADQADGVAHLYALCSQSSTIVGSGINVQTSQQFTIGILISKLDGLLSNASQNLSTAVEQYPLHGILTSIRYVLNGTQARYEITLLRSLYDRLSQVWSIVRPVLCNDAPEGHVPTKFEGTTNTTKETLSYCWRALKESSLLLSTMISNLQASQAADKGDIFRQMSQLCFTQLAELRHRGAFSTVAQSWIACCVQSTNLDSEDGVSMLEIWYKQVLSFLRNNFTINTRRSAGLPSLLGGILVADKEGHLISRAFTDLEAISRQRAEEVAIEGGSLPQVHAMNCIKDMLKNSRLGEQTERYIPAALRLAADALQSEIWAIRNCGLMLFRAVIDRLLGTSEAHFDEDSQTQKRNFTEQHPELLNVIIALLVVPGQGASARYEGVFPALQMLQLSRVPENRLVEIRKAVRSLTSVSSWHVRDKAARTLAMLATDDLSMQLERLSDLASFSENELHGALLEIQYTLRQKRQLRERTISSTLTAHDTGSLSECRKCLTIGNLTFRRARSTVVAAASLDTVRESLALMTTISGYNAHKNTTFSLSVEGSSNTGYAADLENILLGCLYEPSSAVIRQAWARLAAQVLQDLGQQLDKGDIIWLHQLMVKLAVYDENACERLLKCLRSSGYSFVGEIAEMLAGLCHDLIMGGSCMQLKCEAQTMLLSISAPDVIDARSNQLCIQTGSVPVDCNQRYIDQSLQLSSLRLDRNKGDLTDMETGIIDVARWAGDCVAAVNKSGIHTTEAAAEALNQVRTLWQVIGSSPSLDTPFLKLCIAIYDLLNDDEEEIRAVAASITTRILTMEVRIPALPSALQPLTACRTLLEYCVRTWPSHTELYAVAFSRAFGVTKFTPVPVADRLIEATRGDNALFAEEKQNLYVDEVREVRIWSQVLQRLSPQNVPRTHVFHLASWVDSGLDTLAEHARQQPDGALGWSTNESVFILGLRVIYGVKVLFGLVENGTRISIKPSDLRKKLFACVTAFGVDEECGNEVNCLWRTEATRILTSSVTNKIKMIGNKAEDTVSQARREQLGEFLT